MRCAAITNPYEVSEIEQNDVLNFHEVASRLDWKVLKINRVREIQFISGITNMVAVKYGTYDAPPEDITLQFKTKEEFPLWVENSTSIKYSEKLKLDKNKLEDLKGMIGKGDIPKDSIKFIQDILDDNEVTAEISTEIEDVL